MKKYIIYGFIATACLTACNNKNSNIETHTFATVLESTSAAAIQSSAQESTESSVEIPVVTYNEILSGKYKNTDILIDCIIDNAYLDKVSKLMYFDPWFINGNSYKWSSSLSAINMSNSFDGKEYLETTINGEEFRFHVHVSSDNSIDFFAIKGVEKITPIATLEEVKSSYINSCAIVPVDDLLRSPESHKMQDVTFSGSVFQIVKQEDDGNTSFLLDTGGDNGIIYVLYKRNPGDNRILENDSVTIYGMFYLLDTYTSVLGADRTVPRIGAKFLTLN